MVHYKRALELQLSLLEKRMREEIGDVLLLLEHPHTFTVGRNKSGDHLLVRHDELERRGIHFEVISRGGDITYHGPGQLVGYAILDLNGFNRDIHRYLRNLEETIILALRELKIEAERKGGLTGVWVKDEKIASIGVGIRRWITYHGFALNINTDLSYFDMIVPCGIRGVRVTSIKRLLGKEEDIGMDGVETGIIKAFSTVFDREPRKIVTAKGQITEDTFGVELLMSIIKEKPSSAIPGPGKHA